ncbi:MAG: YdcF family protein [Alphaproteobacteria bacterium]|nr:YdcF family protein [Alphaproteobacteria bacterium]
MISLIWAIGLAAFVGGLPLPSQSTPARTQAIAVYTGGGGARIVAGMALFADGAGNRLLISGVHPDTSRARVAEFWKGAPELFDCCVDLGREALSTDGNAAEVSQWVSRNDYNSIVIVTSDYHMPRALAASRTQMPDVTIHSYVVASGYLDPDGRPNSLTAWRALAGEYSKFLLARVKAFFSLKSG